MAYIFERTFTLYVFYYDISPSVLRFTKLPQEFPVSDGACLKDMQLHPLGNLKFEFHRIFSNSRELYSIIGPWKHTQAFTV